MNIAEFVKYFDYITIVVSVLIAVRSVRDLRNSSRYIVYYLFFVVFILPLALDYLIGKPVYSGLQVNYGFELSYDDDMTRILYDIFVLGTQIIILKCFKKRRFHIRLSGKNNLSKPYEISTTLDIKMRRICLFFAAVAPIFMTIRGYYQVLFRFGWRDRQLYKGISSSAYYGICEKLTYIGVTAAILLLLSKYDKKAKQGIFLRILSGILLMMNSCIEAKRAILFYVLIVIIIVLIQMRNVNIRAIAIFALISVIGVLAYTYVVKIVFRGYVVGDGLYRTIRIDMFRDDTVKMSIYGIMHPDEIKILDYPFQSYLMQIKYFIITSLISGLHIIHIPGVGYDQYFSAALAHTSLDNPIVQMTVSMFDEAIANFGYFGFFIAPIVCAIVCRKIDEITDFEKVLWLGGFVLYMMFPLKYILYYIEIVGIIYVLLRAKWEKGGILFK